MINPKFPTVTPVSSDMWVVEDEVSARFDGFEHVHVPAGFETDGASVPRAFWWFAPKMSPMYLGAAVVHDWLYANEGRVTLSDPSGASMTRKQADDLFLACMFFLGMRKWRARLMYRAVRSFGPRW